MNFSFFILYSLFFSFFFFLFFLPLFFLFSRRIWCFGRNFDITTACFWELERGVIEQKRREREMPVEMN